MRPHGCRIQNGHLAKKMGRQHPARVIKIGDAFRWLETLSLSRKKRETLEFLCLFSEGHFNSFLSSKIFVTKKRDFMGTNRLCKNCGTTFETNKTARASKKMKRPVCSNKCALEIATKIKACKPNCSPETLFAREVFFKNGTNHLQQACYKCLRTKMLPKIVGIKAGIIPEQRA